MLRESFTVEKCDGGFLAVRKTGISLVKYRFGEGVHISQDSQGQWFLWMATDMAVTATFHFTGWDIPENAHVSFQHRKIQLVEIFLADFPDQWNIFLSVIDSGKTDVQRLQRQNQLGNVGVIQLKEFQISRYLFGEPVSRVDVCETLQREKTKNIQNEKPPFAP